jgi:outer membrane protein TolC
VAACAGPVERSTLTDLRAVERTLVELPPGAPTDGQDVGAPAADDAEGFRGHIEGYLAYAFAHRPALRASFEEWRAATYRPRQARRLPEPTVTYAGFVRSVETRVGPQRHRLGATQWFPWPTKLTAGGRAASLDARAAQRRFEAHALDVAAEVAAAYWSLWRVHRRRDVLRDEVTVLGSLVEQVRVRVEVGMADLADLAQLDLQVSRSRDRLAGLDEQERSASAALVAVLGAPDGTPTPVTQADVAAAPIDETVGSLAAEASEHPRVASLASQSDAQHERVRQARADRFPSFGVGVDWILTGPSAAAMPPADSGQDAVALSLSLKVPLWTRAYRASEDEAGAHSAAYRARAIEARNRVAANVRQQAAAVTDDVRRIEVLRSTLVPQAQAAFESVLSSYAAGRSSVAELLLSEQALLGLQDELYAAAADYGTHLAALEREVGRPVRTKGSTHVDR